MKKLILIALLIGITFSCEDFEGWNVDGKNPSSVDAGFLVTSAQKELFTRVTGIDVNYNNFNFFAQYWNETQYTDEVNYDIRGRDIGGFFSLYMYRDVLIDLNEAAKIISADEFITAGDKATQLGVVEMISIYTWHVLVDTYGYVPYSEALQGLDNLVPVYESGESIYTSLFSRLDIALTMLNETGDGFGGQDLMYGGSTAQWQKFGNSLKLRMAVRTADFDLARSTAKAGEAVNAGVFESNDDNAAFPFEVAPPNTNDAWSQLVQAGRNDFVLAATFVDHIAPLNDPRSSAYMQDNLSPEPYTGAPYGAGSSYTAFTHIGEAWHQPDKEGIILSYDEVQFLLAEAVERGLITGDAEMYYNAGVSASIIYWGGTQVDADTYLAQASVAYGTAATTWKEVIGNQKYIALYGRGWEAWGSWRLLDFPNIMVRPPISEEAVPRRYLYPNSDPNLNEANYDAASAAMGGDDKASRVFWDINGQGN